jgi:hypothetical protein
MQRQIGWRPNSREFGYAVQIRMLSNRARDLGSIVVWPRNKNDGSERQENARFLLQSLAVQA